MLLGYVDAEEAGCPFGRIRYRYSDDCGCGYTHVEYGLKIGRRYIINVGRVVLQDYPQVWMAFLGEMVECNFGTRLMWLPDHNFIRAMGYDFAEKMRVENFLGKGVRFIPSNGGVIDFMEVKVVDFMPIRKMPLQLLAQEATYESTQRRRLLEELRRRGAC